MNRRPPAHVQSLLVPRRRGLKGAIRWAIAHGFKPGKGKAGRIDVGEKYFRIRQFSPGRCKPTKIRTIQLGKGVKATICQFRRPNPYNPPKGRKLTVCVVGEIPGRPRSKVYWRPKTRAYGRVYKAGEYEHPFTGREKQLVVRLPDGTHQVLMTAPKGRSLAKWIP